MDNLINEVARDKDFTDMFLDKILPLLDTNKLIYVQSKVTELLNERDYKEEL